MAVGKGINRSRDVKASSRPDFHQLETFLKVVETRSFAETARQLGVSQPAVSQTIARLEEILGGDLFERRRGSPATLTPIGRAILPKAQLLLFTVDQQIDHALATAQSAAGSLTVGFHTGLASGPISSGIAAFRGKCPKVEIQLVEASPAELHRDLNERSLDIIFTGYLTDAVASSNQIETIWREAMVLIMPDSHALAASESVGWVDIAALRLVLRSSRGDLSAYRAVAARMGKRHFHCDLHDVSRGALMEMIRLGFGVTISFASTVFPRDGLTSRLIIDDDAVVEIDAIWPRDDRNPLRHRFLSLVREQARKLHSNTAASDAAV